MSAPSPARVAAASVVDDAQAATVTLVRTALETIPDVELVEVGTWEASTGPVTFTADDLASAVGAQQDPAVRPPVIKIGHVDPRFNGGYLSALLAETARTLGVEEPVVQELVEAMPFYADGQPALGRVVNMRLDADGTVLVGDLAGMPAWLAEIAPYAYPSRSIEGAYRWEPEGHWGYETPRRTHRFVLTGLALLGESLPAVSTITEVRGLFFADAETDE